MTFSSVLFLVGLLIVLIRQRSGAGEVVHFVVPTASLGFLLLFREFRGIRVSDAKRFSMLAEMAGPFLAGAVLPIFAYLIPYIRGHTVTALLRGVFILPARRIAGASMSPPELLSLLAVVPTAALFAMAALRGRRFRLLLPIAAALSLAGVWYLSAREEYVYQAVWYSAANLIPVLILAGVAVLTIRSAIGGTPGLRQQQLMLLLSALSLCSVVQFPFSAAIYFCYVAPLVALTLFALLSLFPQLSQRLLVCVLGFYLLFAVTRITPGFIYEMEESYKPDMQIAPLNLDRAGGLRVTAEEASRYQELIAVVREHTRGPFIYAAPDCPEVYFLAGFRNPTRSLFDFLDDSSERRDEVLNALESHQVNVIVIYDKPAFSGELPETLRDALEERFPSSREVGPFDVRWRS
jgi:hypothetical protein